MDPYLVLLFVLLLFILFFGGLSLLRRESLSARLAVGTFVVGGATIGLAWVLRSPPLPVLFFAFLYLVAMRARLVVEIANALASRGRRAAASRLYALALRLAASPSDRRTVLANQGAALLVWQDLPAAVTTLQQALAPGAGLGVRVEAACRCNLGLAYLRQQQMGQGRAQLQEVIDLLPGSIYARRAQAALQQISAPPPQPSDP